MIFSPVRFAISDAPRSRPRPDQPSIRHRPRGPRRSHIAATVDDVRHLVETTLMTYAEIARSTGVRRGTIWHWSKHGNWMRPAFAPRWTHTVPAWRAGRQRRRRMLGVRLVALAERTMRALEAASAVDAVKLREARALLIMARLAARPQTPRARLLAAVRPVPDLKPGARVKTERSGESVERAISKNGRRFGIRSHAKIARTPGKTMARNTRRARRAPPDFTVEGITGDVRPDGGPRHPHPATIAREDVSLPQQK